MLEKLEKVKILYYAMILFFLNQVVGFRMLSKLTPKGNYL